MQPHRKDLTPQLVLRHSRLPTSTEEGAVEAEGGPSPQPVRKTGTQSHSHKDINSVNNTGESGNSLSPGGYGENAPTDALIPDF